MNGLVAILLKHQVNFSVEFFAHGVKIRVRQSGVFEHDVLTRGVFIELKAGGYEPESIKHSEASTPTALIEYYFPKGWE